MSCKPYFDPTCFFSSNCSVKNSDQMLNVCDQSKLLHIPYFEKSLPANLYQRTQKKVSTSNKISFPFFEGYQNFVTDNGPGKFTLNPDECPNNYSNVNGTCMQVCSNCGYRDKDKTKSRDFNEFDPCFPNGVYDGVTNDFQTTCTCGKNNQYCSKKTILSNLLDDIHDDLYSFNS